MRYCGLFLVLGLVAAMGISRAADLPPRESYQRPADIPSPPSNPLTIEKVTLGKTLFFDPRLSRDGAMSCATCHSPNMRWSDGRVLPLKADGVPNARRTPTVLNSAWLNALMWDGRAASLEAQAVLPITTAHEMNFEMPLLLDRLKEVAGYQPLFTQAFGDAEITPKRVTQALASFQRTLVSKTAPFDRWVAGDENAISENAKRGFALFEGKANCVSCHKSWRFTEDAFHDIGLESLDPGRGAKVPSQLVLMQHAFKTPSLRDLPKNGPFMHDGSMHSLEEVIKHYEQGGVQRESLSQEMKPFELSDVERAYLIDFIHTLDGGPLDMEFPNLPE
ncbi:cytochrome c peroxidase [Methylobacillus rhizosphaerae]|uniref:Methylamine utilization protein MauG n=1 Tax=Methylobacillus rhizosphaerae TaxID=551994 RepID=A0A238Z960_9PROT|nr:tryptophan tryptophylquinone biosynthesis enzyme MauG [Methylobacillus rhizosphaerae]SNR79508.1 cytochrome c peroxidase [Methylobacillus rhizosphaerae]